VTGLGGTAAGLPGISGLGGKDEVTVGAGGDDGLEDCGVASGEEVLESRESVGDGDGKGVGLWLLGWSSACN